MSVKKIKFSNNLEMEFVNSLRGRVKAYFDENGISKFGNTNMVLKSIFMFALYFVPYILMITGVVSHLICNA
jgi:linoleoyl-CoA desaturase